MEKDGGNGGRW